MSKKTIDINPDLFSIGKTRKKRDKKQKSTIVPLISPNVLKNKLLKRIKEHKQKETEGLENNRKKLSDTSRSNSISTNNNSANASVSVNNSLVDLDEEYTNEFNDSINYLQTLSKQKKENEQKATNELYKQRLKEEIERKTVKNYQSLISSSNLPPVNIDLPEELKEGLKDLIVAANPQFAQPIVLSQPYKVDSAVPYGCLKNGVKPNYKDWNKTQKNMIVTDPKLSVVIDSNIVSERESRLNQLKSKIKEKQIVNNSNSTEEINFKETTETGIRQIGNNNPVTNETPNTNNVINNNGVEQHTQFLKRTIRKKYTLGKTKNNRTVGVLIKDRNTRKQVLTAQRELKKKSVNDIKTYLKDHNLIKVGSNAPNDVLRKMYEASMLAGEITNSNSDTLLHNLLKDDKEL
jgi:hypothetical protein